MNRYNHRIVKEREEDKNVFAGKLGILLWLASTFLYRAKVYPG